MIPTPRYDSSLPSSWARYRLTLRLPDIDSLLSSLLPSRYGFYKYGQISAHSLLLVRLNSTQFLSHCFSCTRDYSLL